MLYAKIPMERIGALIGPGGEIKKRVEDTLGIKLIIDSTTGEVTIDETGCPDPSNALKAQDFVKAIGRGFSTYKAERLLADDTYLEVTDIREFAGKSEERVQQVRARLIGTKGKTRKIIEELTGVDLSIYGNTVSIIGDYLQMEAARHAVLMLLKGSEHSTVYRYLEKKRAELRIAEMGF